MNPRRRPKVLAEIAGYETESAFGWAWRCDFGLCHWAEPSRQQLIEEGKPSPEAMAVRVFIVEIHKRNRAKAAKGKR